MLDLDHPQTKHIFAAGGLLDRIKLTSQAMTVAPTPERLRLLAECRLFIQALHRLNDERFGASSFISQALARLETGLRDLAGDERDPIAASDGASCPRCGAELMHIGAKYFGRSLCSPCLEAVQVAELELDGFQGFGTIFI